MPGGTWFWNACPFYRAIPVSGRHRIRFVITKCSTWNIFLRTTLERPNCGLPLLQDHAASKMFHVEQISLVNPSVGSCFSLEGAGDDLKEPNQGRN